MTTPHKHAALIKAWADGATIQALSPEGEWKNNARPHWALGHEYRIKPEPESDSVLSLHLSCTGQTLFDYETKCPNNMVCTFDGETKQLKSIRMIGKPDPAVMEQLLRELLNKSQLSSCNQRRVDKALHP